MRFLVRPRAWWFHKTPLSVTTYLLLVDGHAFTVPVLTGLVGLIGAVSAVGNYGYALNELFDQDEDRRAGRANATDSIGVGQMRAIIVLSAIAAVLISAAVAGRVGALLTLAALLLPLAYSVPPARIKERGWAGVLADALAAHVFPALLALTILGQRLHDPPAAGLSVAVVAWALAVGLRGILSHLLQSDARDRTAGLQTVVHRHGHGTLRSLVVAGLLPLEVAAFAAFVLQSDVTAFFLAIAVIYLGYEALKVYLNPFPVTVFTPAGERYLPFVDEGFYRLWAPLALSIDAAISSPGFLALVPVHCLLYRPHALREWRQLARVVKRLRRRFAGVATTPAQ